MAYDKETGIAPRSALGSFRQLDAICAHIARPGGWAMIDSNFAAASVRGRHIPGADIVGTENFRVDKYQYEVHQDVVHSATREITLLYLFDQHRNMLCAMVFMPDDQELAKPEEAADGHVAIQMHEKSLARIVDMLRNEKPVYFSWWPEGQAVRLSTSKEPVGEHELRKLFSFLYV